MNPSNDSVFKVINVKLTFIFLKNEILIFFFVDLYCNSNKIFPCLNKLIN
ncbi:hypothetical protein C8N37_1056 [Sphingobacterium faecium]|nr:hypothetical protein C8N37_1056 [Sphingobacterium faecium]